MSYLFMPNKEFLLCPVCNLIGKQDCVSLHLVNLHQWSSVDVQYWLSAIYTK